MGTYRTARTRVVAGGRGSALDQRRNVCRWRRRAGRVDRDGIRLDGKSANRGVRWCRDLHLTLGHERPGGGRLRHALGGHCEPVRDAEEPHWGLELPTIGSFYSRNPPLRGWNMGFSGDMVLGYDLLCRQSPESCHIPDRGHNGSTQPCVDARPHSRRSDDLRRNRCSSHIRVARGSRYGSTRGIRPVDGLVGRLGHAPDQRGRMEPSNRRQRCVRGRQLHLRPALRLGRWYERDAALLLPRVRRDDRRAAVVVADAEWPGTTDRRLSRQDASLRGRRLHRRQRRNAQSRRRLRPAERCDEHDVPPVVQRHDLRGRRHQLHRLPRR